VLVIALIMLVMMTLLAISAAQITGLNERMAGFARDRDVAFQAAEAGLREGERVLQQAVLPAFDSTAGLYPILPPGDPPRWKEIDWSTSSVSYGATIAGVAAQPRYIVEEIAILPGAGESLDAAEAEVTNAFYRVTGRALGGEGNTVVVLQTTYRRR
jgi:type IV pilus assembly protein PilX